MDDDVFFVLGEIYFKYRKQVALTEQITLRNEELAEQNAKLEMKLEEGGNDDTVQTTDPS